MLVAVRTSVGRLFQTRGAADPKAREAIFVLVLGSIKSPCVVERRDRGGA